MLELISTEELAKQMRYSSANNAFRDWLVKLRITPVPGRKGFYDPALVRHRLDEAQGLAFIQKSEQAIEEPMTDFMAQRRARRGEG